MILGQREGMREVGDRRFRLRHQLRLRERERPGMHAQQQVAGDRIEPARAGGLGGVILEGGERAGADLHQGRGAELDGGQRHGRTPGHGRVRGQATRPTCRRKARHRSAGGVGSSASRQPAWP